MYQKPTKPIRILGITINLEGGIGNQLFQYAAGLALASSRGCNLIVNTSRIQNNRHGGQCITDFILPETCEIDAKGNSPTFDNRVSRAIRFKLHPRFTSFKAYFSTEAGFDEKLLDVSLGSQVNGYFQTYKYWGFLHGLSSDLVDLKLKSPSALFHSLEKEATQVLPIVLHFRRGDYLALSQEFGLLSTDYYRAAVEKIVHQLPGRPIWIYSDDLQAAKKELIEFSDDLNIRFMEETMNLSSPEVLSLMSVASGHVIANSSFSWWSANLSTTSSVILAPTPWFRKRPSPLHLLPDQWHLVNAKWE